MKHAKQVIDLAHQSKLLSAACLTQEISVAGAGERGRLKSVLVLCAHARLTFADQTRKLLDFVSAPAVLKQTTAESVLAGALGRVAPVLNLDADRKCVIFVAD